MSSVVAVDCTLFTSIFAICITLLRYKMISSPLLTASHFESRLLVDGCFSVRPKYIWADDSRNRFRLCGMELLKGFDFGDGNLSLGVTLFIYVKVKSCFNPIMRI